MATFTLTFWGALVALGGMPCLLDLPGLAFSPFCICSSVLGALSAVGAQCNYMAIKHLDKLKGAGVHSI